MDTEDVVICYQRALHELRPLLKAVAAGDKPPSYSNDLIDARGRLTVALNKIYDWVEPNEDA